MEPVTQIFGSHHLRLAGEHEQPHRHALAELLQENPGNWHMAINKDFFVRYIHPESDPKQQRKHPQAIHIHKTGAIEGLIPERGEQATLAAQWGWDAQTISGVRGQAVPESPLTTFLRAGHWASPYEGMADIDDWLEANPQPIPQPTPQTVSEHTP